MPRSAPLVIPAFLLFCYWVHFLLTSLTSRHFTSRRLTHSLTDSLTYSFTHSLTHPLAPSVWLTQTLTLSLCLFVSLSLSLSVGRSVCLCLPLLPSSPPPFLPSCPPPLHPFLALSLPASLPSPRSSYPWSGIVPEFLKLFQCFLLITKRGVRCKLLQGRPQHWSLESRRSVDLSKGF